MIGGRRAATLLSVVLMVGASLTGCHSGSLSASDYARDLQERISTDAVMAHLQKLQDIANANGGTRVAGTPGYDASVDYVVNALRDKGFDVQTPEFDVRMYVVSSESLTVNGSPIAAHVMENSGATGRGGLNAPLVAVPSDDSPGCQSTDYDGLPVTGAIVLVDRGECVFGEKISAATDRGAVGLILADNEDEKVLLYGLAEDDHVKIPVMWVSKAEGAKLRAQTGPAKLVADAGIRNVQTRNVIAQTTTGSTENVVVVGAHLDSVRLGPGINDNGSGVAAVLETALQMGSSPRIQNAVRFAFFGAEEEGLLGSTDYVTSLDLEQLTDIALFLDFDMIASPNPGYFALDGNVSKRPDPDMERQMIPEGSAAIDRAVVACLDSVGKKSADYSFDGRSDYGPFTRAGIPAGGVTTGAEMLKTTEQAALWGGQADVAFDPNYHSDGDTISNVNRDALGVTAPCVARLAGVYAQNPGGRFRLPMREDRTRHVLEEH